MIWSTEKMADFIELAIDAICNGAPPDYAFSRVARNLGYSWATVEKMVEFERFANGVKLTIPISAEDRIKRLQKLRNYIHKDPHD